MRVALEQGDKIQLLPQNQLLEVFRRRNFFLNDETRIEFAEKLGGKRGTVMKIEDRYQFDYFYFKLDNSDDHSYSIPYGSVDFDKCFWIR